MKILETTGYNGEAIGILVDHILAITPTTFRFNTIQYVGCSIVMQDASPDGTTFAVRETYSVIRAKLEEV